MCVREDLVMKLPEGAVRIIDMGLCQLEEVARRLGGLSEVKKALLHDPAKLTLAECQGIEITVYNLTAIGIDADQLLN